MRKKDNRMAAVQDTRRKSDDGLWETVKVIIQALLIAFFVRSFLYQPFNIPSESMYPTLKVGDYLFVSKLSYGYGKYSFNFSLGGFGREILTCCPIDFPGRVVLGDTPKRGDVAVFKLPSNTDVDYIKRVIGLPGDRIQMRDGVLHINGAAVKKERIEDYADTDQQGGGQPIPQYLETLPNGVSYRVLDETPNGAADNTQEYVVPEGHYFMMGDNRDNSQDSRFWGFLPAHYVKGQALFIYFSFTENGSLGGFFTDVRWGR
ncbi:MAG: signal peptidase I, partial [Aestuariivirga sp.]